MHCREQVPSPGIGNAFDLHPRCDSHAVGELLRKPSGHHHKGNLLVGFNAAAAPGDAARARYDLFQNWILNGAPQ